MGVLQIQCKQTNETGKVKMKLHSSPAFLPPLCSQIQYTSIQGDPAPNIGGKSLSIWLKA